MSKATQTQEMFTRPYAPVEPLPKTDATTWRPSDSECMHFHLGNRAFVQELTGSKIPSSQKWRWRVGQIGGDTGVCDRVDAAMRAAEFSLGIGEMPVQLPEIAARPKKKGGAA